MAGLRPRDTQVSDAGDGAIGRDGAKHLAGRAEIVLAPEDIADGIAYMITRPPPSLASWVW